MRVRLALILSVGLNSLLGLFLYLELSAPPDLPPARSVAGKPARPATVRTNVVIRRQNFSWREIESPDYPTYIANLRSIGCPEPTIRDIIAADVNELFARREANEVKTAEQQWWRSDPDPGLDQSAQAKLRELDDERRALLVELLGPNWESLGKTQPNFEAASRLDGPILGKLTPEKKMEVHQLEANFAKLQQDYLDARKKAGQDPDPAELARQRKQMREQLSQRMNPEQMEEYLLRYSQTAHDLRRELRGLNVSPDEFRSLFRLRDPLNQQIDLYYSGNDPATAKQRAVLEAERDSVLKQTLGPDRYQLFKLLQDPVFRQVRASAQEIGAPPDTVMPVYQIRQATEQERQRIAQDLSMSPEQRAAALQAAERQEQESLRKVLGVKFFEPYQQNQP